MHSDEGALVIPLKRPIAHAGGEIVELRLREPTAAEMRDAERKLDGSSLIESSDAFEIALLAAVSGLDEDALNSLPVSVMQQARTFVVAFDLAAPTVAEADELEIELPRPLTIGGVLYSAFTLREPTVGMRRRARTALRDGVRPAAMRHFCIVLVAEASGVPFAAVEQFPISVVNAGASYLEGFTQPGRPAGSR